MHIPERLQSKLKPDNLITNKTRSNNLDWLAVAYSECPKGTLHIKEMPCILSVRENVQLMHEKAHALS